MIQHDSGPAATSLEILGDLFFSAPTRRKPAPRTATEPAAQIGCETDATPAAVTAEDSRISAAPEVAQKDAPELFQDIKQQEPLASLPEELDLDAMVLLAGGLPVGRRLKAAWAALRRLVPDNGRTVVLTLTESEAWLQPYGAWEEEPTCRGATGTDRPGWLTDCLQRADGLAIVLAEPLAQFDSALPLPASRVVLAEGGAEAAIAAYAELKSATAEGQAAELFVIDSDGVAAAEAVYRRLAQVAISHLEVSPTFAGHTHREASDVCPLLVADVKKLPHRDAMALLVAAAKHYRQEDWPPQCDDPPAQEAAAQKAIGPEARAPRHPPVNPQAYPPADYTRAPGQDDDASQAAGFGPPTGGQVTGRPDDDAPAAGKADSVTSDSYETPKAPPPDDQPPVSRIEATAHGQYGRFDCWQPSSRAELLAAARAALPVMVQGVARVLDPRTLVEEPDLPDLIAFDEQGRAAGVIVSVDGGAADASRAAAAAEWVRRYERLLALAADVAASSAVTTGQGDEAAVSLLLVPSERRSATDRLEMAGVQRLLYRGVSFDGRRGITIEQADAPAYGRSAGRQTASATAAADQEMTADCHAIADARLTVGDNPADDDDQDQVLAEGVVIRNGLVVSVACGGNDVSQADDEGLTEAELAALKKNLEFDEMT